MAQLPQPDLLDAEQAAARLGVSIGQVRKWGQDGTLTRVTLARRCVRYPAAAVDKLISSRTKPSIDDIAERVARLEAAS